MPWLSWHIMRHTCATLTKTFGMLDVDRRALMGHADEYMTDRYTHEDFERMRALIELIAMEVTKVPKRDEPESGTAARANVISITAAAVQTGALRQKHLKRLPMAGNVSRCGRIQDFNCHCEGKLTLRDPS